MTTKSLRYEQLVQLAVAEGATTPNPGLPGVVAWSTTLNKTVEWDGSTWGAVDAGGGGGGSGDVVGPSSSVDNRLVTFNGTTGKTIKEATFFDIPDISNPAAPAAGNLRVFTRSQAGRQMLAMVGPSGIDTNIQPALFRNTTFLWVPNTGTTVSIAWGTPWTARNNGTSAAQATPARASTNALTSMARATFGTGTTATGQSGFQSTSTVAWRGNAAGLGGFFYHSRFAVETYRADIQLFIGLSALNALLAGEPSVQNNSCGICKDAADTQWQYFTRSGTTTTKVSTGVNIVAGDIYDFMMFCPPNGTDIKFRMVNVMTGAVVLDDVSVTTNLPVNTTFLYTHNLIRSTTGTTAALLAVNRVYLESDL